MKAQCLQCLNEFESTKEAKFCSPNCRLKHHRNETAKNETDENETTSETPVETDKESATNVEEEEFETINGVKLSYDHVCIECKKPVHPLITICLPCFTEKRKKQLEGNKVVVEPIKDSDIKDEEK